jgi:hypothetical protein
VTRLLRDAAARLAPRERRLLAAALAVAAAVATLHAVTAVWNDFAALAARTAARERELATVQALAARLQRVAPAEPGQVPLLARLEEAARDTVGREHIAEMRPATAALGPGVEEERVALRVSGASLAEIVGLLHALETGPLALPVARLELQKLPQAPAEFAATVEVTRTRRLR